VTRAGAVWFLCSFVACLAASFAVYWPALRGDYIWDDRDIYILNNPLLPKPDGLYRFWFTTDPLDYYPLAYTVYWLGVRLWGLNPLGFHLTNVVVHALASTFLAWTLKGLRFPDRGLAGTSALHVSLDRAASELHGSVAALVGVLFALHPMNVESVAWIAQLKTCLAGMLAFAAAGCFIRGWTLVSFVLFALSLSSKPIAVAFPVAILVFGWWRDGRIGRSIVLQSLPFFAASLLFGAIGVYFQQANAIGPTTIRTDSTLTRLLASSWAVWFYAWKSIVPVDFMFVYPRWDVPAWGELAFLPAIALFGLIVCLWWNRGSWGRTPLAILAVYLLMILPSSGLVDVYFWRYTYVGDHYAYQALPLVLASAVGAVWMLLHRWQSARSSAEPALIGRLLSAAAMAFLAVQSLRLSKDYTSDVTLWTATLRRNPDAWLAHTNLASKLFEQGEMEKAEKHTEAAYRLRPDLGESHNNKGLLLSRKGLHEEAAKCFRAAADRSPYESLMWENLGVELYRLNRDDEALQTLRKSVDVSAKTRWVGPKNARPLCELANQLAIMGQIDEALATFKKAGELRPDEPLVPLGVGHIYKRQGKHREAADEYRKALNIAPRHAESLLHLGLMQEKLGDLDGAFQSMLAASDRSTEAFIGVAWMRSASPKKELRNPRQALLDVEATQPASVYGAMVFDAHAVALAANSRFADAVRANENALAICRNSAVKDLPHIKAAIHRLEQRGELYRKGQAFVGPTSEMTPVLARES
jgi:protein O-mannosyl-transferase